QRLLLHSAAPIRLPHSFPTRRSSDLSIETVCTSDGLTGALATPLEGMTRFTLFSINGVVIMKIISNTKARSSSGVILISESVVRSEEHTSELQSLRHLVCRLLLEKKN